MNDVFIKFEGSEREGIVAVGTYLADAARRLGFEVDCVCRVEEEENSNCKVSVLKGSEILSPFTTLEEEQLSAAERKQGQRLACQAKFEKPGEIIVMTMKEDKKKAESKKTGSSEDDYKKEFQEMPLEQKISSLVELEVIALGETISFVMNSPYEAAGKVMNVLAGFGRKQEAEAKESKIPKEHKANESKGQSKPKPKKKPAATSDKGKSTKSADTKNKTQKKDK